MPLNVTSAAPVAWPDSLFTPVTDAELDSGVYAVHEAGHAVAIADLGFTVNFIDITRAATEAEIAARGWAMGSATVEEVRDEPNAIIVAAARPATTLYLHLLGLAHHNRGTIDGLCRHDDERLRYLCGLDPALEPWVRNTAERWVVARWPGIVRLAEALIAAGGRLDRPDIPPAGPGRA